MDVLRLRFDAPLMSFGGVMVDQHGPTERFPSLAMLTGLFGNALGYRHSDAGLLTALQERIEYAARWDVEPKRLVDYHTVDLGQQKMRNPGWTTRGTPEHRAGGPAATGTHQRYRHYWADGVMTLAVALVGDDAPTLDRLEKALRYPARPLFLGRKTCLPAAPLVLDRIKTENVLEALQLAPRAARPGHADSEAMPACWPIALAPTKQAREAIVYDQRDWHNQVPAGRRARFEGLIREAQQ